MKIQEMETVGNNTSTFLGLNGKPAFLDEFIYVTFNSTSGIDFEIKATFGTSKNLGSLGKRLVVDPAKNNLHIQKKMALLRDPDLENPDPEIRKRANKRIR